MKNTGAVWIVLDHNFLSQTEFPNEIKYSMAKEVKTECLNHSFKYSVQLLISQT